jgi:5'-nucleotidase
LLVESEGGQAEEIIDEENGILISAILRQYFMSLRTIGQWKHLSEHWLKVAENCQTPIREAPLSPDTFWSSEGFSGGAPRRNIVKEALSTDTSEEWRKFLLKRFGLNLKPLNDDDDSSSDEGEDEDGVEKMHFELLLMRKFWSRWVNKTNLHGLPGHAVDDGDFAVDWTRVIAPVVEGRIKIVSS